VKRVTGQNPLFLYKKYLAHQSTNQANQANQADKFFQTKVYIFQNYFGQFMKSSEKRTNMLKIFGQATLFAQLLPDSKIFIPEFFQTRKPIVPEFCQPNKPICKNISRQLHPYVIFSLDEEKQRRQNNIFFI
jgi:hypothetical protein